MTRLCLTCFVVAFIPATFLAADPPARNVNTILGVQRAMTSARDYLRKNQYADAARALEAELINADGNVQYLTLLHDAYAGQLRGLQLGKADAARIEEVRQRLKILEGGSTPRDLTPVAKPSPPRALDAEVNIQPPPIPAAPTGRGPAPTLPAIGPTPAEEPRPAPVAVPAPSDKDPFQQTPLESAAASADRAGEAFADKRYAQATALYVAAAAAKEPLSAAQKDEWAYSRLYAVAQQLNGAGVSGAAIADLGREVEDAIRLGSDHVLPFGQKVMEELRRRQPPPSRSTPTAAAEWEVVAVGSFRVMHHGEMDRAAEIARTAQAARVAMYERWAGAPAADWSLRCDVYLHATGSAYASATGKSADNLGHSAVGVKGGQVVSRRIDIRGDDAAALDDTLPHEVTQVVVADLFADQPLPRWAVVGMAGLAESPTSVARYRRAIAPLLRERKLFDVGGFLDMAGFPDAASITPFYAESVSLVGYLVEIRGPKAFTTFLREAPRRGYAKALQTHYGFRDTADLQAKWLKAAAGAPAE